MEFCFTKFLQLVSVINFPSFFLLLLLLMFVCLYFVCLFFLTTYKISSVGKKSLVITYFRAHE